MTDTIDCLVVGAGVVGLAIARRLALAGHDVAVVESEDRIGCHTSSRNSEVIHAGLYYPAGSLKGTFCVAGKHALYQYCAERRVPHQRIGKVIVATNDEEAQKLEAIQESARRNGVDDLVPLGRDELRQREPAVAAVAALFSPSTGIIDSHVLMLSLQGDLEAAGGHVVLCTSVVGVSHSAAGFDVRLSGDETIRCRSFINCAGLAAADLANNIEGLDRRHVPSMRYARGHYFAYRGRSPFTHLVYPVPFDGGLGIHATNDLSGAARFGPDVVWLDDVDYEFDESRKPLFVESIKRYFPAVEDLRLQPSYTGIRPKLHGQGEPAADFRIDGPEAHGVSGLVNLFGIESPGLTSCLAIADHVENLIKHN